MSREPFDPQPSELLRRLASEPLPVSAEDAAAARRERMVRAMQGAVDRTAAQAERGRRLRRVALGLAAAAALALLGGLAAQERQAPAAAPIAASIAGVERVSGTVVLTHAGAGQVMGVGEGALRDGDAVETTAGARARLTTKKAAVEIAESTLLALSRPNAAEERISLRRGRVDVAVEKHIDTQRAVVVETPDVEVVVRGTVFDVRVDAQGGTTTTHVHVSKGSVWVLAQGRRVALLSAGQSYSSAPAEVTSGAESSVALPPAVTPSEAAPPSGASSASSAEPPLSVPAAPPVGASRGVPAVTGASKPARKSPGTLTEENRLFAAGVDARNRGEAARAAELFGELLARFPQSALREAAQVERFRALDRAGQKGRAASEARRYLAEHRDGFAQSEARALALDAEK